MKISRDRLKQIIKEELQSLALAEVKHTASADEIARAVSTDAWGDGSASDEEERDTAQSPERKRGERLKSQLGKDRDPKWGDAANTEWGGRTMQPGEALDAGYSGEEKYDLTHQHGAVTSDEESSQDAGLYMAGDRFKPESTAQGAAVGMFSPDEMAASKLAKKDYGKGIPDYMRAGYKGDAPGYNRQLEAEKLVNKVLNNEIEYQAAKRQAKKAGYESKFVSAYEGANKKWGEKSSKSSSGGRKAWKSANRAMKAAAKAAGKTWQTIGPNEKTELGKQAWKAKLAARKAYKSMKSGKAAGSSRAVAKKLPLPKLRTREPGDVQGLVKRGVEGGGSAAELAAKAGSEAKPTGLASVGVKKPDTAIAKAPTKKATRKRTLAQMTQTELDGVRRELAAENIPVDDDAKRIYDNQVKKNIANLRKTNPNLSVNGRRIKAQIRARKQIIKTASRMIAAKNKQERDRARTNMMTGVDLE